MNSKFRSLTVELTQNNIYIIIKSIISATDKMKCSMFDPQTKYHSFKLFHICLHSPFFIRKYEKQNLYFYDIADTFLLKINSKLKFPHMVEQTNQVISF